MLGIKQQQIAELMKTAEHIEDSIRNYENLQDIGNGLEAKFNSSTSIRHVIKGFSSTVPRTA
ncbi:hypothetical protein KIN20_035387 [Parelaphostrongylus tenuis]|uniref:Uncharacterized protein n=1 Tax=Parelaphostrongylus tenuis TaxID=148309 RepID=A0AAD5WKS3_PARTN|nr:hypothetical protein KIN20_035387 [Parelaphostrongylus tenuis]